MARSIRIEFEGAVYHVMARGNRREAIFLDDEDRKFFLQQKRHWTYRGSQESRAHGEKEAEQLLVEGLRLAGLREEELEKLPGSDPRKAALAA